MAERWQKQLGIKSQEGTGLHKLSVSKKFAMRFSVNLHGFFDVNPTTKEVLSSTNPNISAVPNRGVFRFSHQGNTFSSVIKRLFNINCPGNISKVFDICIGSIVINMVNIHSFWSRAYKCLSYNRMNIGMTSFLISPKGAVKVTATNTHFSNPASNGIFNFTLIRNKIITFKTNDIFPNFFHGEINNKNKYSSQGFKI